MTLPVALREGVERALVELGLGNSVASVRPAGGGCINNGARLDTDTGAAVFLKWNASAPAGMFEAEAEGLDALRAAGPLRVPEPLAWGADGGASWLLMEYVPSGSSGVGSLAALGTGLARLHAAPAAASFGWSRDNWIGSLEQVNATAESWSEYWRDRRIGPQLELARRQGRTMDPVFDALLEVIPLALDDVDRPELIHGDLWGGNWFAGTEGEPVLIDPAVYRGHGEVDLAMSELFGGFGAAFYQAYDRERGVSAAYDAFRRELYQLYYLLVHVNLFGGAYEAGSQRAAEKVLAQLR